MTSNSGASEVNSENASDAKVRQVLKQVQSYKLLSAKLPSLHEPLPADPLALTPKEYRTSAAYLSATDMPIYNLIDIASYALNPTSQELGRKVIEGRTALSPGALVWSMEPTDIVHCRLQWAELEEAKEVERLSSALKALEMDPSASQQELIRARLRLKRVQLAGRQREVREQVLVHAHASTHLDSLPVAGGDGSLSTKRHKRQSLREPRMIERAVKERRVQAKSAQSRKSSDEFLRRLSAALTRLSNDSKASQQRMSRVAKAVAQFHAAAEKEEQKKQERLAKERIKALKADDEEAYLRLIDQEKDTRLTHLLKQTDEFLDSLTARVHAQQIDMSVDPAESDAKEDAQSKKDYYQTAHRVKEEVIEQPNILVGGRLKEYQMKGLQWLVSLYNNHLNGILADEMGLGKTIQAISLISYLMEKKAQTGPFLIIVPLSTITNWVNEFEKWAPSVVKVEYKGSQGQRKAVQQTIKQGKFNVLITTYEYIIKDRPVLSKFKWLYMIIDEGHRMKNTESKLVSTLTNYYSSRFRLILTGTPLQNNLPELWALLNFVLPRIFNSSKTFEEWFNAPFANTGEKVELNEEETLLIIRRLHKVLRPFLLRRMKKDVEGELPDKIERVIKCPMSALQHRLYQLVKAKNSADASGKFVGMRRLNNTIMQLRKICNHPFVFEEVEDQVNPTRLSNDLLWRCAGKFELLSRLLPKLAVSKHRVLIFFQMTQVMTIMEDFLLHSLGLQYLRLDGSTKAEDRAELLRKFNAPDSPFFAFLLSTRAGGLGLNLQTADTVIIFDSDWNPHQDLQAQDRAHRIGQTKEVRIYRLITVDSVEEYILEKAQFKLSLDGKVIQAGKFDHKSTNEEREAMLRALLEGDHDGGVGGDDEEEVYDDEELNEIVARDENELQLFRQIDDERSREWAGRNRLIEERELPRVYLADAASENGASASHDVGASSGRRQRMVVNYDESLCDKQFENSISLSDSDSDRTKKLKLVLPVAASKSADNNDMLDIYDAITECVEPESGRSRSEIFLELPPRDLYPDYYKIIRQPISMSMIRDRINNGHYAALDDMIGDFDVMYSNAMYYNQEGSVVWNDAMHMRSLVHSLAYGGGDRERSDAEDTGRDGDDADYDNFDVDTDDHSGDDNEGSDSE